MNGVVVVHGSVYGLETRDERGHAQGVAVGVHGHVGDVLARDGEAGA